MRSFALIACDHGFGHVRRVLLIARGLASAGVSVSVLAPARAVSRFISHRGLDELGITLVDFSTHTTISHLGGDWLEYMPSLDRFDVVISDNLVEILARRPDAILSGSFLWHLVVESVDAEVARRADSLLAATRPRMIASHVFAIPELAELTRLSTVGLYAGVARPSRCGDDLLIACGGTSSMETPFRELIGVIAHGAQPPYPTVWVEPRLLPSSPPPWMRAATFDEDQYRRIAAAVCRPGVGTLTDCLWAGARTFHAWEAGNAELALNASRLVELGTGESASDPSAAFLSACRYARDDSARVAHAERAQNVDFDGVRQTIELLLGGG